MKSKDALRIQVLAASNNLPIPTSFLGVVSPMTNNTITSP